MTAYLQQIKEKKGLMVVLTLAFAAGIVICHLLAALSPLELQKYMLQWIPYYYTSIRPSDEGIRFSSRALLYQLLLIMFYGGLLKILNAGYRQILLFILLFIATALVSISLTAATIPNMGMPSSDSFNSPELQGMIQQRLPFTFFSMEFQRWIFLNAITMPIFASLAGHYSQGVFSRTLPIITGSIFAIAGVTTAPLLFSQIELGIIFFLLWLSGFVIAKILKKRIRNSTAIAHQHLVYASAFFALVIVSFFIKQGRPTLLNVALVAAVTLFCENMLLIAQIFKSSKVSGLLALFVPFYLPFYILKNIERVYRNKTFYKVYAILLIVLTLGMIGARVAL